MARRKFFTEATFSRSGIYRVSGLRRPFLYERFIFLAAKLLARAGLLGRDYNQLAVAPAKMQQENDFCWPPGSFSRPPARHHLPALPAQYRASHERYQGQFHGRH
jgi:hypothetical protein